MDAENLRRLIEDVRSHQPRAFREEQETHKAALRLAHLLEKQGWPPGSRGEALEMVLGRAYAWCGILRERTGCRHLFKIVPRLGDSRFAHSPRTPGHESGQVLHFPVPDSDSKKVELSSPGTSDAIALQQSMDFALWCRVSAPHDERSFVVTPNDIRTFKADMDSLRAYAHSSWDVIAASLQENRSPSRVLQDVQNYILFLLCLNNTVRRGVPDADGRGQLPVDLVNALSKVAWALLTGLPTEY